MPTLLVLNHHGSSFPALVKGLEATGAKLKVTEPSGVTPSTPRDFDGVVASGGYLTWAARRKELEVYSRMLDELERPFLGVCLGLKILGHRYGARMRRIDPVTGMQPLHFVREYPLAIGIRDCNVFQGHRYELIPPLPAEMENYATDGSPVQAVKIRGKEMYGVQFHPELSGEPAIEILRSFVSLC